MPAQQNLATWEQSAAHHGLCHHQLRRTTENPLRLLLPSLTALVLVTSAAAQLKPRATDVAPKASELPITRVALYKNGVGFFEHAGRVSGDQAVTIDFTSAQLNDVLQSLTAIDLNGGRISGAGYNSTTPLEQQLKTLPLALDADPSDVDFYNAIRGARVQVSGPGVSITGRLLSIDLRQPNAPSPNPANAQPTASLRFITVISEAGQTRTVELTPATSVTLLDTSLHTDVTRYLELLASTRNQGLRHLTLLDRGQGNRDLRVSYISEVPVWKSTYRILFTDGKSPAATATVQGWSVVDNTTGSDWTNVHLDLIAGAPQSFIQPLSIPYYARRPEVPLPAEAQLAPQTHDSGEMITADKVESLPLAGRSMGMAGMPPKQLLYGFTGGSANGVLGGVPGGAGIGPGAGGNMGGGTMRIGSGVAADYDQLAQASLAPATTTAAFDDFFEYTLTDPITIRKNESALVPILQTKLPIERVTLWSPSEPFPLRALWVTNSSTLTLDRGSFSIVENGSFGGEGLLDAIHPGEKRLLSYAADQAVHIDNQQGAGQHHLRSIVIAKGILTEHYRDVVERDYGIRNAAPEARTVVIEHPRTNGYQLHADTTAKPDETLPNAYRFRVQVPAGATVHLKVAESHAYPRSIQVGNINDQQIKVLIAEMGAQAGDEPALLKQLQPILDAQRAVADLNAKKNALNAQLNNLRGEEERQRANIVALKDADKLAQKRFVDELGRIEDQILDLQKQQTALDAQIVAAQQDLTNKVQTIQFDQTLEK
jgi:hypothetical protein